MTFKLKSGNTNAGFKIKGYMNGTWGYTTATLLEGVKFPPFDHVKNLTDMDSVARRYVLVTSDSISVESNPSIGQEGLTLGLHFIPGTATKGELKVEFWEHPHAL